MSATADDAAGGPPALGRTEVTCAAVGSVILATVLLLPLFASGSLLHFDLVATPHIEITPGVWGLGPELPRLGPLEIVLAAFARIIGGPAAVTLFLWSSIVTATLGAHLLARRWGAEPWSAAGAAVLYGCGPWIVTRLTAGHLTMVGAAAVLPWLLRRVVGPAATRWSIISSAAVLAVFGFYGGLLAGALLLAGLVAGSVRPTDLVPAALVQLVWSVPAALVFAAPGDATGAAAFPSGVDEVADVAGLFVGMGFWQDLLQVGGDVSATDVVLAVVVAALASVGAAGLETRLRRGLSLLALAPVAAVLADSIPVLRNGYARLSELGPLIVLREPQRLVILTVVVLAPLAAVGSTRLAARTSSVLEPSRRVLLVVVAVLLAAPGIAHVRDTIEPTELPPEWAQARERIDEQPGGVLVLPWERYLDIGLVDGRRVLNPALAFFGGDVRIAGDLGLAERSEERRDAREGALEDGLADLEGPVTDASYLASIGIDWIVLLHEIDYTRHLRLLDDPALEPVIAAGSLDLIRVAGATGPAETSAGAAVTVDQYLDPLARVRSSEEVVWDRAYQRGWLRGFTPAQRGPDGRLVLAGSSSVIWYWPALLVVGAYVIAALVVIRTARSARIPRCE
ncbi:MAG: hypothetical protein ACE367_06530 [Acidimicrobiales bacterium]